MTDHPTATGPTPAETTWLEELLEAVPFVDRACVARLDDRETVVLASLDPRGLVDWARARGLPELGCDALATHPTTVAALQEPLSGQGCRSPEIRVVAIPQAWLPGRDVFPAHIRRRCARARYAPLLLAVMAPVAGPVLAA